jgi:hypothetical protein
MVWALFILISLPLLLLTLGLDPLPFALRLELQSSVGYKRLV